MAKKSRNSTPKRKSAAIKRSATTSKKSTAVTSAKTAKRAARSIKAPDTATSSSKLPITKRHNKLPNVWQLTKTASVTLWQHKEVFLLITLLYGLLNLVLVRGLASSTDVGSLRDTLNQVFTGHLGSLVSSLSVFVLLVGSAGNSSSNTAGAYQFFLALIGSLAIIWALRQALAGVQFRVRDAYYRGMYPLIPFILVLIVCGLQLLPLLIGSSLYSLVINNGIAVHSVEKLMWAVLFIVLTLVSLYMLSASLFALYIVTLPDMTPLKALRSARELVQHRRWAILRKILWLPLLLLVVAAVIMVPIIIVLTALAQWVFFLLTMLALLAVHAYMYTLYRELLNE